MAWFSEGAILMTTYDFWLANFLVYVLAFITLCVFIRVMGVKKGMEEAHVGAIVRIPRFFNPIIRYVCPTFLAGIFILWMLFDVIGIDGSGVGDERIADLFGSATHEAQPLAQWGFISLIGLGLILCLIAGFSKRFKHNN
jgi:hypothetical protein